MNDKAKPSTAREALIAEILGDLDVLLSRAEALPQALKESEIAFLASVAALDAGGDRYRMAITQFNEEAKREIHNALERSVSKGVCDQSLALQDAARQAFLGEGSSQGLALSQSLSLMTNELNKLNATRTRDMFITAVLSGTCAAVISFILLKTL